MNKKYEFTGETKNYKGRVLHRIKRISDGLVGGWVEKEENLSHSGDCFIYGNAVVYDNARVYDNAEIYDYAKIFGYAEVCGYSEVCGYAKIFGYAKIYEGRIIGQVCQLYKDIFQHQCKNRILTAILTENDKIFYSIGCQDNITKEVFLDRIYNEDGGLEENPHREEYLRLIPLIEQYFKN